MINACWQVEGDRAYVRDELLLMVNRDSGRLGWQKDYGWANHVVSGNPEKPISIFVKSPRAPLLGEQFPITIYAESIKDLNNVEVFFEFIRMDGIRPVKMPVDDMMVAGESSWRTNLVSGVPVSYSRTIKLMQEGDWQISFWIRRDPDILRVGLFSINLHIGKDTSSYGWPLNHDPPPYNPLRPSG